MPENELQLVLEAIGGNRESFGRLADRYSSTLLGLIYSIVGDAEAARDLTQEALLKAYTALSSLQRPDRFGSWLRQIAANLARTHLRTLMRRPQVPLEDGNGGVTMMEPEVESRLARQEILERLQAVPEGPRTAVVLHYLVGLPPADAAKRLGISRAAFDTRLSRGREALRRELTLLMDEALTEARSEVTEYLTCISERVKASLAEAPRERAAAARELAVLAARANLPRLVRDLKSPDEGTRKQTAQLLGDTLDARAAAPAMEALKLEEAPAVQAELCRTLERLGATAAAPMLYQLSRNTADMTVHKAAADAERALRELDGATPPTDIPVEIDDLKAAGIEALFLDLLADESPSVRVHAADGLGRVESVKAIAPLARLLLQDPQDYVRRAAAAALGAILWKERIASAQRAKGVEALAEALADQSMPVQSEAAWSLSLVAPADSRRPVMERFFTVLEQAVQGKPGPWFATFPALAGALGDPADRVRMAELLLQPATRWKGPVIEALARMGRPGETDADALLAEALKRKVDPRCEWNLVRALGASASPATAPTLLECLRSANLKVREEAAAALGRQPQGREQLKAAMATGDEALVMSAVGALDQPEDLPFLEELALKSSGRGKIAVQAAAKRLSLNA